MSISYRTMNILEVNQGIVAHGCNTKGVMGAGIAKAIANKYPEVLVQSKITCSRETTGLLGNYELVRIDERLWCANLYTQTNYGRKIGHVYADVSAIRNSLESLKHYRTHSAYFKAIGHVPKTIYMPKIGCGLGGLNWEKDVRPIVESIFEDSEIHVTIVDL